MLDYFAIFARAASSYGRSTCRLGVPTPSMPYRTRTRTPASGRSTILLRTSFSRRGVFEQLHLVKVQAGVAAGESTQLGLRGTPQGSVPS